jgi:staphylococcal nuclease domain-containing protein 1
LLLESVHLSFNTIAHPNVHLKTSIALVLLVLVTPIRPLSSLSYSISKIPVQPSPRLTMLPLIAGRVKSVSSGDTIVISSVTNSEVERELSLAYCIAPHFKKEGEEEWAFQSREALRRMAVGKVCQFQVIYEIPNTKRQYGHVYLNDGLKVAETMVEQGWLKLRVDAGQKETDEEVIDRLNQMRLLESTARSEGRGIWASNDGHIDLQRGLGDSKAFLDTWKGKTIDGIVERVLSGDKMFIRLLTSPTKHIESKSA